MKQPHEIQPLAKASIETEKFYQLIELHRPDTLPGTSISIREDRGLVLIDSQQNRLLLRFRRADMPQVIEYLKEWHIEELVAVAWRGEGVDYSDLTLAA